MKSKSGPHFLHAVDIAAIEKLPKCQREAAFLAAMPSDEARQRLLTRRKRHKAYARSKFNRTLQGVFNLLTKARSELMGIAIMDPEYIIRDLWKRAGAELTLEEEERDDEERVMDTIDLAENVRVDASGILWAIDCYLSVIENAMVSHRS